MTAPAGGNDALTRLLLTFEGSAVADTALGGWAKTFTNGGELSTDNPKFGSQSLYCYGVNNNLAVTPSEDFRFGTSPFTVDCWGYQRSPGAFLWAWWQDWNNHCAVVHRQYTSGGTKFYLALSYRRNGLTILDPMTASLWSFVVWGAGYKPLSIERYGTTIGLYFNNALVTSHTLPADHPCDFQQWPFYIGRGLFAGETALRHLDGYVDEFRVHNDAPNPSGGPARLDAPTRANSSKRTTHAIGRYQLRRSATTEAAGRFAVALWPRATHALGRHHVRADKITNARGTFHTRIGVVSNGRGIFSIGSTTDNPLQHRSAHARGKFHAREGRITDARGEFNICSGSYAVSARGVYILRRDQVAHAQGEHTVYQACAAHARGHYTVESTAVTYALYHGAPGFDPDFTAAPYETFASLPHTTAAITGAGVHSFALRAVNSIGLESRNITAWTVELDGSDNEIAPAPSPPRGVAVTPAAGGTVRVVARYDYLEDAANLADTWLIYVTSDGTDPDPAVDTPTEVDILTGDGHAKLGWTSPAYTGGATIKVIVRTRRTTPLRDSTNTAIVSTTATTTGPAAPVVKRYHRARGVLTEAR